MWSRVDFVQSVYVVSQDVLGKDKQQGFKGSFCQAFAYCRAIQSTFVWLICFLMDLCALPPLLECVRCLFMKFISSIA